MDSFLLLAAETTGSLPWNARITLSVMQFLEYAVWGAWYVVLGNYLNTLGFNRQQIGRVYATIPIGAVISPMFLGVIADRYFPAQDVMGVCHVLGAVLLYWLARIRNPQAFFWVALAYSLLYTPTLGLSNTVIFEKLKLEGLESVDFPFLRVFGTIGWIAAGLSLKWLVKPGEPMNNKPLLLASVLSAGLGVFSFFLRYAEPKVGAEGFPLVKAFQMFEDQSAAIFLTASFLISMALAFYYAFTALYLEQGVKVKAENVGPLMTIGQWVEIIFMLSLPWFLKESEGNPFYIGMRWVLIIGIAAWAVRYAIFAARPPLPLVIVGIGLHGICFDFFLAAGMIHTQDIAPDDIKASAQQLFGFLTYGLGMWIGTEAAGWLNQRFTHETVDPKTGQIVRVTDWTKFWAVPCIGVTVLLAVFVALFRMPEEKKKTALMPVPAIQTNQATAERPRLS